MARPQPGPPASTSAGHLRRHLSPDTSVAQGNAVPAKPTLRRPTKRNRSTPESQHSARQTQTTSLKDRAISNPSDRTAEMDKLGQLKTFQPMVIPQQNLTSCPPIFSGNFDLYGMYLPSLAKAFLPPGATTPDYPAVYNRILASQAKHDYTARCFLAPHEAVIPSSPYGRFESSTILNPMAGLPFDITLDSFTYKQLLTFTDIERSSFQAPQHDIPGPGLVGHTRLYPACGIKDARGVFKIKRVWAAESNGLIKELFEGFFSFSVCYDSTKADHGNGAKFKFAFWGVRAMKDNTGKEIGLGMRKAVW